ncbi:hypothetical protein TUM12370_00540 [Salmonella enterica subsp. enterica serovar Choleraesuis]|nr:hypothetical protein TUM12370_00540 [Salmonella enterica subsp. enterica serovar Choleraesuis]
MGKVFIYGFFPTLLMSTSTTTKLNKYLYAAIYLLTFIILTSALYLKFSSKIIRLDFGIGSATGAAYTILLIGFISGTAILCTNKKNLILYILNTASVFTLILFTETRSAILVFPVISIITIAYTYGATRKELLTSTGIFIILIALVLMTFKDQITHRYEVALNDIQQYKNSNSWTSLGARLAMYEVGLKSFQNSPLIWKSAESRAENIRKYARENKIYNGALPFLNIHLHNEIIESASIKGIAGILSTMIFYLSLCILAFRRKSILLAGLLIAIVSLGLSDVLLWARSIPIIIIMTIVIAIAIESHKKISSL